MSEFSRMPLSEFIRLAASDAPTPGGGGIAALAGALGAAMASMAANFTVGRPKFAQYEEDIRQALDTLEPLIRDLQQAVDDDAAAFSGISAAYKLPKTNDVELANRKIAIDCALTASMRVPLRIVRSSVAAADLLPGLAEMGNPNLLSDVEVAAIMLEGAVRAATVNVFVNSRSLATEEARDAEAESERAICRSTDISARVREIVARRNAGK